MMIASYKYDKYGVEVARMIRAKMFFFGAWDACVGDELFDPWVRGKFVSHESAEKAVENIDKYLKEREKLCQMHPQ